jgi:hypothetical protein
VLEDYERKPYSINHENAGLWWLSFWVPSLDGAISFESYGIGYILSMLGLNGPVFELQWGQDFIFSKTSRPALTRPNLLYTWDRISLLVVKIPKRVSNYPPHVAPCSYRSKPSVPLMVRYSVIFNLSLWYIPRIQQNKLWTRIRVGVSLWRICPVLNGEKNPSSKTTLSYI